MAQHNEKISEPQQIVSDATLFIGCRGKHWKDKESVALLRSTSPSSQDVPVKEQ